MEEKDKNKKPLKTITIILLCLAGLVLVLFAAIGVYTVVVYSKLGSLGLTEETGLTGTPVVSEPSASPTADKSPEITITPTETPIPTPEPIDVINILVIGCDTKQRGKFGNARSDVNLILTIDQENDEIKLTTFMRDIHIYYEDLDRHNKLNASLQYYNHPDGVVNTIEDNFDVEIDHYMLTDYWGMADLINVFNGIKLRISDEEISAVNDILAFQNRHNEDCTNLREDFLPHDPGTLRMTGRQAVAYMRVRAIGTDFQRIERQYEVLHYLKDELQDMTLDEVIKILNKLPDMITTDMSANEILSITKILYSMKDCDMQTQRVPFDDTYELTKYEGRSVVEIDFEKNIDYLHEYMYK